LRAIFKTFNERSKIFMQLKGLVKFLTIVFIVVSLYQLSFTVATKVVESKADKFANAKVGAVPATLAGADLARVEDSLNREFRRVRRDYLDSIQSETVINLGIVKYNYRECRDKQINLGLDLKGGMNIVLEISEDDVLRKLAFNSKNETFNKAIIKATELQKKEAGDFLSLFAKAFAEADPNAKLSAIFAPIESYQGKIKFNSTNDEVISVLRKDMDAAIKNTYGVLKTRIDQFGVAAPNISLQEGSGRITLELPGVDDPTRVRRILSQTAQLEFWDTYENQEIINLLDQANTALRARAELLKETASPASADTALLTATDTAAVATTDTSDATALLQGAGADTSKIAAKDTANKNSNPLFEVLYPSIYQDGNAQKVAEGPIVGRSVGKDTAKVNRYLEIPEVRALFPRDVKFLWGNKPVEKGSTVFALYAIKRNPAIDEAPLTGDVITSAIQNFDQYGVPEVDISMNSLGSSKWEKMTDQAVNGEAGGKAVKKCIAIVLDSRVYSAPRVQTKISGGRSQITGIDDLEEATDLANVLKSGKLEARTRVVEEQVVGPSLGKEAIQSGLMSLAIGFLMVFLFMVAYYSSSGLIANVAMVLNLFLIVGVVASIPGATFTLPGMAGIVLTLGMAVDANVIINERIREELARGKGIKLAVEDGYRHSMNAILDGNLTTMIVGFVLLFFGLGPVKGFAVVLVIGLFTSLFTAVLFSRLLFNWAFSRNMNITFGNKVTNNLFRNFHFDFLGARKYTYGFSALIFVVCIGASVFYGFDLGVDFKGGRSYVIAFDKNVSTGEVAETASKTLGGLPQVKTYGAANQINLTTAYKIEDASGAADSAVLLKVYESVKGIYASDVNFETFQKVYVKSSVKIGATVADDIRRSSFFAGFFAIAGVFIYIFARFRKIEYAIGAIIALVHDPILVLGAFSLLRHIMPFSLEIDQNIVAAILTLIGYSVNDTVVVFDRIREFIGLHPTRNLEENVNASINTTLSRTIMTAATVFLVSLVLFIFGGEAVRGFSFALLIGVAIGTYSSIFVASPIMVDLMKYRNKNKANKNETAAPGKVAVKA
jgi:SecD/SecF fusion protein